MTTPLARRGFLSLVVTQFLGACHDLVLKTVLIFMLVEGLWAIRLGEGGQGIVGLLFPIPFILCSGWGGQIVDRWSKRRVTIGLKIVEVPIACVGFLGFWFGHLWLTIGALLLLRTQSAVFGPAKYGLIPELVDGGHLSRANGTLNMMTSLAVIAGTVLAGPIADGYWDVETGTFALRWLPGVAMLAIAAGGVIAVLGLPRGPAGDADLKWDLNPIGTYVHTIREIRGRPIMLVMLAWGFFYFLATLGMLIIPEYTIVLDIEKTQASLLMGVLGIGVGAGSGLAGLVSGHRIEPRLIPVGGLGLAIVFGLLGCFAPGVWTVGALLGAAGVVSGFYVIPLQALLQHLSPTEGRGRFLGTANAISFSFQAAAGLLYWTIAPMFAETGAHRIFLVCSGLMLVGGGYLLWRARASIRAKGPE